MKKQTIITKIIERCGDCPHFSLGFLSEPSECNAMFPERYFVTRDGVIPDWCPLENAE